MWPSSSSYLTVVEHKRDQRTRALATAPSRIAPEQEQFIKATASDIVSRIKSGEWTATQVLEAYIASAKAAHERTNCLTEVMFEWARERAKALDTEFIFTGELKGPLHGVPMSIKDHFEIQGFDTSVGFTKWANDPAKKHSDIVEILLEAGAVPFVKTNIPQTMFAYECSNPLWGRTTNPYNDAYTSGGSSGGEGALIAMDGSPLGIGSDIGGSLRIPAAYCGIYSLKPSSQRVAVLSKTPNPGFEGIKAVAGPMGRSIEDLELTARAVFGVQGRYTRDVAPIPFRPTTLPSKLKFGFYTSDGFVKASPACKRAVLETVDALRKQGHKCVEIEIPNATKALGIFTGISSADGYRKLFSHVGPDPFEPALRLASITPKLPRLVRKFLAWIVENVAGDKIFADTMRTMRPKPMHEYNALIAERNEFTHQFQEEVWEKYGIDGIIAPVQAIPQLPHGGCNNFLPLAGATIYYNIIDNPVGVVPVCRVDSKQDQVLDEWWTESGHGSKILETGLFKVVGQRWEDEKVLAMMKVVDNALGSGRAFGPGAWSKMFDNSEA